MKRKRFIKLLMGVYCMPRNAARKCAEHVQRRGGEYLPEILKCEMILQQFAREYSLPISLLLSREKGLDKKMRRFLKSDKRAAAQLIHHPKPYSHDSLGTDFQNMQVMSRADHAALHGGGGA